MGLKKNSSNLYANTLCLYDNFRCLYKQCIEVSDIYVRHTGVRPRSFSTELAGLEVPLEVPLEGVDLTGTGDGEAIAVDMAANSSLALVAFSVSSCLQAASMFHVNHT